MKHNIHNFLWGSLLTGAIALGSCQKNEEFSSIVTDGPKPTAAFTNTSGSMTVSFTNGSTNGDTYYWQFGDGTASTEASPVHTYNLAGYYTVTLKTNSAAGYSSFVTKTITAAAGLASADISYTQMFEGLYYTIDGSASSNFKKFVWNFGDGTKDSASIKMIHQFPVAGDYTVTLKCDGFFNDEKIQTVTIHATGFYNLLKGGNMESSSAPFWTEWQTNNPPVFGYTGDSPSGGSGGCLQFKSFSNSSGTTAELIYQPVQVVAGKKYQLSAVVKAPANGYQIYFQFYVSTDASTWVESSAANANYFLCLNTWHGWGQNNNSVAVNGDLLTLVNAYGKYGLGAATNGIYTAPYTGTVYIGIQAGTWAGYSNGDFLVDNLVFRPVD